MNNKEEEFKVGDYVYFNDESRYIVGKIYKIIDNILSCNWTDSIKELPKNVKEFNNLLTHDGWAYKEDVMKLNLVLSETKVIKHIINGNKTIVVINNPNGTYSKGVSRCCLEDEFSECRGFLLAYCRALLKGNFDIKFDLSDYSDEELVAELGKRLNEKEGK